MKIDHIGIAVKSLDDAIPKYTRLLGAEPYCIEEVPEQKVKVAMFRVGDANIELLQATADDSPIAKSIERKGEGIHHLALGTESQVADILLRLQSDGFVLIDKEPRLGAEGKEIAFVHPKSLNGVLLELSHTADR